MADGNRNAFIGGEGNFFDGDEPNPNMGFSKTPRRRRKTKKRRNMVRRTSHRKARTKKHSRKPSKAGRYSKKRRGMSKEFLKNLRRKHGLGEFKKR